MAVHFVTSSLSRFQEPKKFRKLRVLEASDLEPLRKGNRGRVDLIPCCLEMWFGQSAFEKDAYLHRDEPDVLLADAFNKLLAQVQGGYDYIIFDCPPGFSTLARAALRLSDAILSPTIPDQVSVRSLRDFHEVLVNRLSLSIPARYVLVTKFYPKNVVHRFMLDRLRRDYNVLGSPIKFSVDIVRATERPTSHSWRTFNEKYGGQTNVVKLLGRSFLHALERDAANAA